MGFERDLGRTARMASVDQTVDQTEARNSRSARLPSDTAERSLAWSNRDTGELVVLDLMSDYESRHSIIGC